MKRPTVKIARRMDGGAVELRVTYHRTMRRVSLGMVATDAQWDAKACRFTARMDGWRMKNDALITVLKRAGDIVDQLLRSGAFTHDAFMERYRPRRERVDVLAYIDALATEMRTVERLGNARIYRGLATRLARITGGGVLPFDALTPRWLMATEQRLRADGCTSGGIGQYMRTLRAVVNRAITDGIMRPEQYPFRNGSNQRGYDVGALKGTKRPRALPTDALSKLKAYAPTGNEHIDHSVRYFLLMYYARGMNFADLARLRWEDIYDGRIHYTRRKTMRNGTGANFSVLITPELERLLAHYPRGTSTYVLPILHSDRHVTAMQQQNRIDKWRGILNKALNTVAAELGVEMRVTTYVARHTFGAVLLRNGVAVRDIGDAYGHTDTATTEHYLEQLTGADLDHLQRDL